MKEITVKVTDETYKIFQDIADINGESIENVVASFFNLGWHSIIKCAENKVKELDIKKELLKWMLS